MTINKKEIIKTYGSSIKDTGSSEVQIALLTERINSLSSHFKTHKGDHLSRRGLIMMVGLRSKLLKYLKRQYSKKNNPLNYQEFIKKLGIRN